MNLSEVNEQLIYVDSFILSRDEVKDYNIEETFEKVQKKIREFKIARSRGMRFHFFIQSFSQLDNVYGKDVAQIILDNCGLIYLKTNTQDTAEAISKRLGKKTIEANSISQSLSIMDYKGNQSTSLIARDLLTPDEVKQLHYKTIIFPIIGYPIFRDTVLYSKLSCYQTGELERKISSLKNLDNTYFTVEQIKTTLGDKFRNNLEEENDNEVNEFFKEQREYDEKVLFEAIKKIQQIVKQDELNYEYKIKNNRIYSIISLDRNLTTIEMTLIKGQVDNKIYHIEIDNNINVNTIEVHIC